MPLSQTVRWIPVAEELPAPTERVIIGTACGRVYVGFHQGGVWFYSPHTSVTEPMRAVAAFWAPRILHPRDIKPEDNAADLLAVARAEMSAMEKMFNLQEAVLKRKTQVIAAMEVEIVELRGRRIE